MRGLLIVILFILSLNTCVGRRKNGHSKKLGFIDDLEARIKAIKLQTKTKKFKKDFAVIMIYIQLQARLEGKLNLCINRKKTKTTLTEEPITRPDLTATTEEYFEPTEKPSKTTEDYFEPTERPDVTTEEYFEPTERLHTTEEYFEPTKMPDVTTEEYFESTERPDVTTEEYFEPTEKPGKTTEDYYEPTERPTMTTEDYSEITDTPTETFSTIVDYPEDVTNHRTLPPTEVQMETITTTMEPWIDTTSSLQPKPWWVTSKTPHKTKSTSTRHTHHHRSSTRRTNRTKKTRPTRSISTISRHTHYHRTSTRRTRTKPSRRTWTIKNFTMHSKRWR
ncbi:uncharacterized protein [Choristoneura fumiferana]|uniref:uncharacterized protein n=1 Tax=Choristoneura fumiferana TaxID=7141 RepID=UPI003D155A8C